MDRVVILCIIFLSNLACNKIQRIFVEADFLTMYKFSNFEFSIVMETEGANFKNTHFVITKNDSIIDFIELEDNEFYLFKSKNLDTLKVSKLVLIKMDDIDNFRSDTTIKQIGKFFIEIVSLPYYGAGKIGLSEVEIKNSYIDDGNLVVRSESNKIYRYRLINIFFRGDAIHYYEYKNYLLGSSFVGYQKKMADDYRPFRK